MKVFFAVPNYSVEDICECGLKVSEYKSRIINLNGKEVSFICAYLNPNDIEADDNFTVLRLIPNDAHGFIAEGAFYDEHLACVQSGGDDFWLRKYENTIMPAVDYHFGLYRKPEYLIGRTLFSNQIEMFDKRKGEPILYSCSEDLYIGKAVRIAEEKCDNFYETAVNAVYEKKGVNFIDGQKYKIYTDENKNTVFIAKK